MRLVQTSPPAIEPVTLSDFKLHVREDLSLEDSTIANVYLPAARKLCEQRSHLCFITQSWTIYLDAWAEHGHRGIGFPYSGIGTSAILPTTRYNSDYRTYQIRIPHGPVLSVDSVQYVDTSGNLQTWNSANYVASLGNPARVAPVQNQYFPTHASQNDAVRVNYTAGYGALASNVPANAKAAIFLVAADLMRYRSPEGSPDWRRPDDLLNSLGVGANLVI